MIDNTNLKKFIIESCLFLKINIESINNNYCLYIPETLQPLFLTDKIFITFEENQEGKFILVKKESHFVQKLAKLISDFNYGVSSVSKMINIDPNLKKIISNKFAKNCSIKLSKPFYDFTDELIICFKISIYGVMLHEELIFTSYNLTEETFHYIDEETFKEHFLLEEEKIIDYTINNIQDAYNIVTFSIQEKVREIVNKIQIDYNIQSNTEIDRINNYYISLIQSKDTSILNMNEEELEDITTLLEEKDKLIEQQINKYNINYNNIIITPISTILFRKKNEKQKIKIESPYNGMIILDINTESLKTLFCYLTSNKNGPFTITHDNKIILDTHIQYYK